MSLNKIMLIGNVGQAPEIKRFENGGVVAQFSLATTDRGYTRKDGTKVEDKTEWHNIVLSGGLAEVAEKYIHKGDKLYVEGKIRTRSYEGRDGVERRITEVVGYMVEMLGSKAAREKAPAPEPEEPKYAPPTDGEMFNDLPEDF